jgi:hypothetical protein
MTLKEKFRPHAKYWDCYNDEPLKYDHENKCVKVADEFAIGFAEWFLNLSKSDDWEKFDYNTNEQLLKIYKKENKL